MKTEIVKTARAKTAKIAAVQMTSTSNPAENLAVIERMLETSPEAESIDCLILPENFACMAVESSEYLTLAEQDGHGDIQTWLSQLAKQYSFYLVAGSLPIKAACEENADSENRVYSSCLVYSPTGERVLRYNKIHLFDVQVAEGESYQESATFIHGEPNQPNTFQTPWGDVAVSICYDIRFPELYRKAPESVVLHCVPAAFTKKTGKAHWQTLLTARAIENQAYVFGVGQVGKHDNHRETWGHSMIIDPWGTKLAEIEQTLGLVSAKIDIPTLQKIRREFPCLSHKRAYI